MKKIISVIMCCFLIVATACSPNKYKRISFDSDELGENLIQYIDTDTKVIDKSSESFPEKFPVYKITERKISNREFYKMLKQLDIEGADVNLEGNGNVINGTIKPVDSNYEDFTMTDEALEKLAWETFNKLPFMDGEYKYYGIRMRHTISDSKGTHLIRVGVSFNKIIDNVRILGSEQCDLYFDNTGLVEIFIKIYNYEKIGTMNMIPLKNVPSMVKNPDSFIMRTEDLDQKPGVADTLQVERTELLFFNQYYLGCTILQPVYSFVGTATDANDVQAKFNSLVIAIPESYTYENE